MAEPHAAALVLQGTQPGSITQAPNSSNVCSHAVCRVGVRVRGIAAASSSRNSKAAAERPIVNQPDRAMAAGLWPLATGLSGGSQ